MREYECEHKCRRTKTILGNSVDIDTKNLCESEIKADITVSEYDSIRIWGQIKDCNGKPVKDAMLKLVKLDCGKYYGVAHTLSDCQGFYQFDVPSKDGIECYKILVSKANTGDEKVIKSKGNCDLCDECKEEKPKKCECNRKRSCFEDEENWKYTCKPRCKGRDYDSFDDEYDY